MSSSCPLVVLYRCSGTVPAAQQRATLSSLWLDSGRKAARPGAPREAAPWSVVTSASLVAPRGRMASFAPMPTSANMTILQIGYVYLWLTGAYKSRRSRQSSGTPHRDVSFAFRQYFAIMDLQTLIVWCHHVRGSTIAARLAAAQIAGDI